ncbi:MAG: hypothetical protein OHK0046_02740 [Anaerolineae bacterium]
MQTGHITSTEWRWVVVISSLLVTLAFVPFLWVLISGLTDSDWQFMGALHGYQSTAVDLAHVFQGRQGNWQSIYLHTSEVQDSAWIAPVYTLLGQIARITTISSVAIFHAARVGAALFMYLTLYQLAASIWMRLRTRRIFFLLVAVGSGFGWFMAPLTGSDRFLDVSSPQAFPFYSTLINVHYPLAIGLMALVSSIIVRIFRLGEAQNPSLSNEGLLMLVVGMLIAMVYPLAFVPVALAFGLGLVAHWWKWKTVPRLQVRWWVWFVVPAVPFLAYDVAVLLYNTPVSEVWMQQNRITTPNVFMLALSFGLVLILALPGMWRAVRRFESDGDQYMLLWIGVALVLIYLPVFAQQRFTVGLMIPLAYFATRSLEDFWFNHIQRRWRMRLMFGFLPLIAATQLFVLLLPLRPISANDFSQASGLLLQRDYLVAFEWLRRNVGTGDVVLGAPRTSLWLPPWTGASTVYGHPSVTLHPKLKRQTVEKWYGTETADHCEDLLNDYTVRYVLYGPQEMRLGDASCVLQLGQPIRFGNVRIYRYIRD